MSNFFPKAQGLYDPSFEHDSCGVGFVCNISGEKSHSAIQKGLQVLERMSHRGAVGADPKTGDGAGILIQMPHEFFEQVSPVQLPPLGKYGSGLVFLPMDKDDCETCEKICEEIIVKENLVLLGWRVVPVDDAIIGKCAKETQPFIKQIFIGDNNQFSARMDFERKLYVVRKQIENAVKKLKLKDKNFLYITNLSSRTFSYKGLLMTDQVRGFFLDLKDERMKSALALVHSRYSTNTFPTWDLAQPFRFLAHNGEINTLRGNMNWMHARESLLKSALFGNDIEKLKPVALEGQSDSATIDNVFELLVLSGRSIEHAMTLLIPGAWEQNKLLDKKVLEFYKYHSCLMEPWDGPAAMAFTDGIRIGALLDRNGLRPARYIVTKTGYVVMSSEVGVLDIDPSDIVHSGRLEPGKIFFIDTEEKRIVEDAEIKEKMASRQKYGEWNQRNTVYIEDLPAPSAAQAIKISKDEIFNLMKAFGYTREDIKAIIKPMAEEGKEPTGSMGSDIPHAILSEKPQVLYNYFKQLFAQVTNPAIDPIREEIVMSLESRIGRQGNILDETEEHALKLRIKHPVLLNSEIEKIKNISVKGMKSKIISILYDAGSLTSFMAAIDRISEEALRAIHEGYTFIILSDRGVAKEKSAIPALLAIGAVHQFLIKKTERTSIGIILESAEPREVHHFALLFGYGADAVNPYLAYETIEILIDSKDIEKTIDDAVENYIEAVEQGILKILSKMGISTLRSYRGAQIFEALGISDELIKKCFTGTPSRIGGATLETIFKEREIIHKDAYSAKQKSFSGLNSGGKYQWKNDGEFHLWNPETIASLQDSVRKNNYGIYKEFAWLINDQSKNPTTLRSLLKFKNQNSLPLSEVEPVDEIVRRFATGAMSFGSISKGAHESMAIAMNRLGGKSNTGEGGENPARFKPLLNGDSARSAIKQVASGRFGVTINYLANADEIQIKIAQGAKPGEGGQLPGHKVSEIIARTRYTTAGVTLISPPPHHDIYSIEDLAQLIFDLKNSNPRARISVKLVSAVGVGTIAAGVAKGHADMFLISGGDGGTGASPKSSITHAGLPWELGISETHQTLVLNDLRGRVRLQTDGQMRTGRDVAVAAILGAEEFGFCTSVLITLGCVMLRHCHLNNCALGVATQDASLEKRFMGKPEYVGHYMIFVAQELREIMASLGIRSVHELIGRTDLLEVDKKILPWKAENIDYSRILYKPKVDETINTKRMTHQNHNIAHVLDQKLIELTSESLEQKKPIRLEMAISNIDRTVGAMLSGGICKRYGENVLPEDMIHCKFRGTAGQSFGAFLTKGVTFELEGLANDYVGKGISGGKIIVYPDKRSTYKPEENILIGNTTFYGAIFGEAYIRGVAGERFCIRNSGLNGVVEGVGDHACEYMTGGKVVILGKTGRNFGAGMSGGIAYVYDGDNSFKEKCNMEMVGFEILEEEDVNSIKTLIANHYKYTSSEKAKFIIDNFIKEQKKFVKVMPTEYKKILEIKALELKKNLTEVSDG
ncbi:glutamate synthase family protein [Candidatus Omnitrophus magneticus]|uniref:Glutamate synthase [NADPH] large chain n=1 Tax=Candidatus Omnitrophus magneticus TaxID=1609969 RepID=A0A0F0CUS0_9BACT|nr:glutamate synthase family protein [Candidatus Omnitrophus magneticus]